MPATPGDDTLIGTMLADRITGRDGNDSLGGGLGDDTLRGNAGDDRLSGGDGNDRLEGGPGRDVLAGDTGADTLVGGSGDDVLILGPGGGAAGGGSGSDLLAFGFDGTVTVTGGHGHYTLAGPHGFAAMASGIERIRLADGGTAAFGAGTYAVCFAAGTRILTATGEVPVERLRAGDLVATLSGRGAPMKPVLWVGHRRVELAGHPAAGSLAPVRVRAGALGEGTPHRDLLVSPDHCLFLDGALVPAGLLVNGVSVLRERGLAEVRYFHVELEDHDVLLAEGAAAESWLDCGNRAWFANAPVALLDISGTPDACATGGRPCAPVVAGGPRLAAIRDAMALRGFGDAPAERMLASGA